MVNEGTALFARSPNETIAKLEESKEVLASFLKRELLSRFAISILGLRMDD